MKRQQHIKHNTPKKYSTCTCTIYRFVYGGLNEDDVQFHKDNRERWRHNITEKTSYIRRQSQTYVYVHKNTPQKTALLQFHPNNNVCAKCKFNANTTINHIYNDNARDAFASSTETPKTVGIAQRGGERLVQGRTRIRVFFH